MDTRYALVGLTVGILAVATVACGEAEQLGSAAVHNRIEAMTDCAALQREFDTAYDNADRQPAGSDLSRVSVSYGKTANRRMEEIGCYD